MPAHAPHPGRGAGGVVPATRRASAARSDPYPAPYRRRRRQGLIGGACPTGLQHCHSVGFGGEGGTVDRYTVISADCHAGADLLGYRPYLATRWHDEFEAWAAAFVNPWGDLSGAFAYRNWDSDQRLAELEADGIVAEVLFPNTIPPFFPSNNLLARPPAASEYERRWAGLQAHNRW